MTELRVSEAVCQAFPRLRIAAVVVSGFDGHEPWPEADAELVALEKAARDGRHIVFLLETTESAAFGPAVDAAAADLAARAATRSRRVSTQSLTAASPPAALDAGHPGPA